MNYCRFQVKKLVRDKVPGILQSQQILTCYRTMDPDEFTHQLKEKLVEEAQEVRETVSLEELTEELADVLEVIHAIAQAYDLSIDRIEKKRKEKATTKGTFDQRFYGHYIEIAEDDPAIEYYKKNHERYPQIPRD